MVHCWEDNAMLAVRYDQLNNMNTYNYTGQQQHDQYNTQMANTDSYNPYQVNYSDPSIQHLAQSASWAGVYAARTGHGSVPQGTTALLEDWTSPTHPSYCGSSNSDSSPSPNGYGYSIPYRPNLSHNSGEYSVPSPGNPSPAPTGHGNVVSVIASHQSHPGDRNACQAGQSGIRPLRPPYDWMKRQTYQSVPSAGKTRTKDKYRVVYTDHQRLELEKEFHYSRYITIRRKAELAQTLSLSERQVKIWFQNRRAKERKQKKKEAAKVEPESQLHEQSIALAQSVQMDIKPQPSLPLSDLSQSQNPHLSHTTLQSPDMVRQEEVPNSSAMEVLRS